MKKVRSWRIKKTEICAFLLSNTNIAEGDTDYGKDI